MNKWVEAQEWERLWWNTCQNTVWEDVKQMNLAPYLGLKIVPNEYTNYRIPLNGEKVLDIGGGPSSLLLKCENVQGTVVDPCDYPEWVAMRYKTAGIEYYKVKGEDMGIPENSMDEVWIYNVLQHTENPKKIIDNAKKIGKIIRIFEWINTRTNEGHPHSFTREQLEGWLGGKGKVTKLSGGGLYGQAFHGIFLGKNYDSKTER
jgi:hypothetical protein